MMDDKEKIKKRVRKPKSVNAAQGLIDALKFIGPACKKNEHPYQKYIVMGEKRITSNDGTLSLSAMIEEDINACPRHDMLLAALSKCGDKFSMTAEPHQLTVSSGDFVAYIPCLPIESMPVTFQQDGTFNANGNLQKAFSAVMDLAKEGAPHVMKASVLMTPHSVIAANDEMIKDYYHGLNFPAPAIIPKLAAYCVARSPKELQSIGCNGQYMTFWFADRSFVNVELFAEGWPEDVSHILTAPTNPEPLPENFWAAVNAIIDFGESSLVKFWGDKATSENGEAEFELENAPAGVMVNGKLLKTVNGLIKEIDWKSYNKRLYFYGDNFRGVIGGH